MVLTQSFCNEANFKVKMKVDTNTVETPAFNVNVSLDCAPNLDVDVAYPTSITKVHNDVLNKLANVPVPNTTI